MLSDLFKAAAAKRSIGDMAYGDTDPGIIEAPVAAPAPVMPAITINIMIGDAKKKKHKKEEEDLIEDLDEEEEDDL
jgi:hypothetical protein